MKSVSLNRIEQIIPCLALAVALAGPVQAHVIIFENFRTGAYPDYDGSGWIGEVFLDIPDEVATDLVEVENFLIFQTADFTFKTPWIDFPAGNDAFRNDAEFETVGDFLDDYIFDVSDPAMLDHPWGNVFIRFTGYIKVSFDLDVQPLPGGGFSVFGPPVWVEFGTLAFDGYRTRIQPTESIYRIPITNPNNPFFHENAIILAPGMYPIEVNYFNRYDPEGVNTPFPMPNAGIEFYSLHGGGLPWDGGANLVHATLGQSTILPPRVIYQQEDLLPLMLGDFDADADIDLRDWNWLQNCNTGPVCLPESNPPCFIDVGCEAFDFDEDFNIDLDDFNSFQDAMSGKGGGED